MRPIARKDGLLVQPVADELVIYDRRVNKAHSLNQMAALVWKNCDGQRSIQDLAKLVGEELGVPANSEQIQVCLDRLGKAQLLVGQMPADTISRRQAAHRIGLVGGLALLTPLITSISAPTPLMASTPNGDCAPSGFACQEDAECCNKACFAGTCA